MLIRNIALLLAAASAGVPAASAQSGNAQTQIDAIVQSINGGDLGVVEILGVPPATLFRVNVTPKCLDSLWDYKLAVRGRCLESEKLRMALSSATIQPLNTKLDSLDVPTAIVFYSKTAEGQRVASLYFNRNGRHGAVNNIPSSFDPDFFPRLKRALHPCVE